MNSVKLSAKYKLYAFPGYQSMRDAMPYLHPFVLAKALPDVLEKEVRAYLQRIPGQGFKNYLEPIDARHSFCPAGHSFITALQLLYKSNGYNARYIVITRG